MTIQFQMQQANCVLILPAMVQGVVNAPAVLKAVGESSPQQLVQLPEFQIATFRNGLQLSFVEAGPGRFNLSIAEIGADAPTHRLEQVVRAACQAALREQPPVDFGHNFTAVGTLDRGDIAPRLRSMLSDTVLQHLRDGKIAPRSAGVKFIYPWRTWEVTLGLEPNIANQRQVIAAANYHRSRPKRPMIARLIGEYRDAHLAFVEALRRLFPEGGGGATG